MKVINLIQHKINHLSITLIVFLFSMQIFAEENNDEAGELISENRTITLKGMIDPRLYAYVVTRYRATDITNEAACLSKKRSWGTGTKKALPDYKIAIITPDRKNNYEITIPIDYVGENLCGYEYYDTEINIRRDKDDKLWTKFTVASSNRVSQHVYEGTASGGTGSMSGYHPFMPENTRKHFQLPNGSRIVCFTRHYERLGRDKYIHLNHVIFSCFEEYESTENGVDELKTTSINLDIVIDEERCTSIADWQQWDPKLKEKITKADITSKDYFRDYQEPPGMVEQFMQKLRTLFD